VPGCAAISVESKYAEFDHYAGARHMLIPVRALPICQIVLLAGLFLSAGEAIRAQSSGNAISQAPQTASPAETPGGSSSKPQSPPEPGTKFEDVVQLVQKEGSSATISNNIAVDLGLATFTDYMLPVQAHALEDIGSHRAIYVIDDTRAVLFMIKTGDTPVMYLADRAGVLRKAGRIHTGRLKSQSFQRIPMNEAGTGFNAEKEFWIKIGSDPEKVRQQPDLSVAKVESGAAVAPAVVPPPSKAAPTGRAASQATATPDARSAGGKHSGTELTVSSTPDGAEIEIDRKVAGNTPMTVPLSHGEHWVTLRKDGYRLWRRRIKIESSTLELNAELLPEKEKVHWF